MPIDMICSGRGRRVPPHKDLSDTTPTKTILHFIKRLLIFLFAFSFRSAFACHGIFQRSFLAMFRSAKKRCIQDTTLAVLVESLTHDIVAASDGPDQQAAAAFVLPDIHPTKVEGVRAKKSCLYIERPESTTETFISVVAPGPVERYMHWLLKAQEQELWLHRDPKQRPIVNLASPNNSPVIKALAALTLSVFSCPLESPTLKMFAGSCAFIHSHLLIHIVVFFCGSTSFIIVQCCGSFVSFYLRFPRNGWKWVGFCR